MPAESIHLPSVPSNGTHKNHHGGASWSPPGVVSSARRDDEDRRLGAALRLLAGAMDGGELTVTIGDDPDEPRPPGVPCRTSPGLCVMMHHATGTASVQDRNGTVADLAKLLERAIRVAEELPPTPGTRPGDGDPDDFEPVG